MRGLAVPGRTAVSIVLGVLALCGTGSARAQGQTPVDGAQGQTPVDRTVYRVVWEAPGGGGTADGVLTTDGGGARLLLLGSLGWVGEVELREGERERIVRVRGGRGTRRMVRCAAEVLGALCISPGASVGGCRTALTGLTTNAQSVGGVGGGGDSQMRACPAGTGWRWGRRVEEWEDEGGVRRLRLLRLGRERWQAAVELRAGRPVRIEVKGRRWRAEVRAVGGD